MASNPESEQLNICMHTLSEYLPILQNFKPPSLTLDNLWIFTQTKGRIWMCYWCKQFTLFIFQSCSMHCLISLHVLEDCDVLPLRSYCLPHNAICSYQNDYIILSLPKHLPSPSRENLESQDLEEVYNI